MLLDSLCNKTKCEHLIFGVRSQLWAMVKITTFILAVVCLAANVLQLEAYSVALKRQSLIFYEPPVENILERADQVSEHFITQRLDNFNHQDPRTFQMVKIEIISQWHIRFDS